MTTPIKVEQVDREAAAELIREHYMGEWSALEDDIRAGRADNGEFVQSLASHRIAAEAKTREEDARAILDVRARNAGNFDRTGAAWEAYDRAVLDCHEAIRSRIPETDNGR